MVSAQVPFGTRLREEIERHSRLVRFVRSQVARDPAVLREGHEQHVRLLESLEARDPEAAALRSVLDGLVAGFTRPKATTRGAGGTT